MSVLNGSMSKESATHETSVLREITGDGEKSFRFLRETMAALPTIKNLAFNTGLTARHPADRSVPGHWTFRGGNDENNRDRTRRRL